MPWWWWPAAALLVALIGSELAAGHGGWRTWVPYTVLAALTTAGLLGAGAASVEVADGVFRVRGSRLPAGAIGEVAVLDRPQTRRLSGPAADPGAYRAVRDWVPTAVLVAVADPDDDTPYWLVSTRRPGELSAALVRLRVRAG